MKEEMTMVLEEFQADIVARDDHGQPVAVVEVKAYNDAGIAALANLQQFLSQSRTEIPFVILADLTAIRIFRWEKRRLEGPIVSLTTEEVLKHYDSTYPPLRTFHEYLTQLIASWLADIAYRWKPTEPPGLTALQSVGLAHALQGGDVAQESALTP